MTEALAAGRAISERSSALLDAWREAHAEPLNWMTTSVKGRIQRVARNPAVANRLKRKPQIVAKLARGGSMRLAQMQDVGGCRVILDDPDQVTRAALSITSNTRSWYVVKHEADYRREGRTTTGYRALHIVVERDGRQIEIQLRTLRQHLWAEAVERAATRSGFDLKNGHGPTELVEFFRVASDGIALLEDGATVPSNLRRHLRELDQSIARYFPNRPNGASQAKLKGSGTTLGSNYWILVYNWRDATFERWSNLGTDSAEAAKRYASFESRFQTSSGYEVVLLGADSAETIERTHAHYFARSADDLDPQGLFAELLRD